MSRPVKQGLDYFPMDVTTDDKFELIEAKYGIEGFGIIIKLFQKIYKEGCYLEWTEEKLLIFKKNINVDINTINAVINDAIVYKIFDSDIYKKYKVLTSSGIQKRFFTACDRRKSVDLNKNFIIVDINSINVDINWINDDISTQSKVKESKVNNYSEVFESFWEQYTRKGSKSLSWKVWQDLKIESNHETLMDLFGHVKRYVPSNERKYIKDAERYLKAKYWEGK